MKKLLFLNSKWHLITCIDEMVESWKPFLNSWRDHCENHAETEADVAHDSSSHEAPSLILSVKLPSVQNLSNIYNYENNKNYYYSG